MTFKSKTILVVDDDVDMLKLLDKILIGVGFTVLLAKNPGEARTLLENNAPHIIITDLHMEPEDGFMFILSVRSQKKFENIPLLVLSALNDFNSVKKAISLGVNDYVIKPLHASMLLRKIRKALLNKDFIKWDASKENIHLELSFKAAVTALGETGYHLKAPIKTTPGEKLKVDVPDFTDIGVDIYPQKINQMLKSTSSGGNFSNDISFVAITEMGAGAIRQLTKKKNQS